MKKLVFAFCLFGLFSCETENDRQKEELNKKIEDSLMSGTIVTDIVSDFKLRMTEGEYQQTVKKLVSTGKLSYSKDQNELYYFLKSENSEDVPFRISPTFYNDTLRELSLMFHSAYSSKFSGSNSDIFPLVISEFEKKYGSAVAKITDDIGGATTFYNYWIKGNLVVKCNEYSTMGYTSVHIDYLDSEIQRGYRNVREFNYTQPDKKNVTRRFSGNYKSKFYKPDAKPESDL